MDEWPEMSAPDDVWHRPISEEDGAPDAGQGSDSPDEGQVSTTDGRGTSKKVCLLLRWFLLVSLLLSLLSPELFFFLHSILRMDSCIS